MAYRRYQRYSNPTPRNIEVKYAGECISCGGTIKAGAVATYYPAGTLSGHTTGALAHIGGLDGNSQHCASIMREKLAAQHEDAMVADYVSAGLGEF